MTTDTIEVVNYALDQDSLDNVTCENDGQEIHVADENGDTVVYTLTDEFDPEETPVLSVFNDAVGEKHNGPKRQVRGVSVSEDGSEFYVTGFDDEWTLHTIVYEESP